MRLSKLIFLGMLCLAISLPAAGQERVKKRAENRANQRVDQKVDDAVNKAADAIEGLFKKKNRNSEETPAEGEEASENTEQTEGGVFSGLGFDREFEPYENPFLMNLTMDMTTTDKRGKQQKMTVDYTFDTWATGMKMSADEGQTTILLDNQAGKMTVVTTSDGKTQGMRMRQPRIDYEEFIPEESEYTITDLGNTKTINGYSCREYLIEHEDGTTNAWLTKELDVDYAAMLRAMAMQSRQQKRNRTGQPAIPFEGFPIQVTTVSKDGKETVESTYSKLRFGDDIDKSVFDTGDIEIMEIGF